jgi:uncharacterized membrane protein
MTDWALFLGRFHTVVLHFPIGLLTVAFLLSVAARTPRLARYGQAASVVLLFGAVGAVGAAGLGQLLSLEGGYDESLVRLHRWSGIGLAAWSLVLVWLDRRPRVPRAFLPTFAAGMLLVGWVGHLGGTLTHGSGYLLAHAPGPVRALFGAEAVSEGVVVIENIERAAVLQDLVMPVLEASCTECHNPVKRKSDLDLTTVDGLLAGGENGVAIAEAGALSSELFRRLILPEGHEDAMPPSGRPRLPPEDVELIGWWIDRGASLDLTVEELEPDDRLLRVLRERFAKPDPLSRLRVKPASGRAIARANRGAFIVRPVSDERPYLSARLRRGGGTDASLGVLRGVRSQLIELDVGGSGFSDESAADLEAFDHLQRLSVQNTAVTDAAMRHVSELAYLRHLNIHETQVTDAGLDLLHGLEHLERVYAWSSGVTRTGGTELLPRVTIDVGVDSMQFATTLLPPPSMSVDSALFVTTATVTLGGRIPGVDVYYTLDGSVPTPQATLFVEPFPVTESARVRAIGIKDGWATSPVAELAVLRRGLVPTEVRLASQPNPEYPGEGGATLADGRLGTPTFRTPQWLGYRETDLVATFRLDRPETVGQVTVSILEDIGSWIFAPAALEVAVSTDGSTFTSVASRRYEPPSGSRPSNQSFLTADFESVEARWVRVRVRNVKDLPSWHPGHGNPAWVFVDEILVARGADR